MKKLFIATLSIALTACVQQEYLDSSISQDAPLETPVFYSQPTVKPTPKNTTHKLFTADKTYMAQQLKELQKIFSSTGIKLKQQKEQISIFIPHEIAFGSNQTTLDAHFEPLLSAAARTLTVLLMDLEAPAARETFVS